jgi:hypothetical protein
MDKPVGKRVTFTPEETKAEGEIFKRVIAHLIPGITGCLEPSTWSR